MPTPALRHEAVCTDRAPGLSSRVYDPVLKPWSDKATDFDIITRTMPR